MAVKAKTTGLVLTGPTGNQGASGIPYINFVNPNIAGYGQLGMLKAVTLGTGTFKSFDAMPGQLMTLLIRPLQTCSLASVVFTNTSSSAGGVSLALRNYANDAAVYSTGSVPANNFFQNGPFTVGQYQLVAGNTYYWSAQGSANGSYTCWIVPQYYAPSGSSAFTSQHPPFQLLPSTALFGTTTLSNTATYMGPATFTTGTQFAFAVNPGAYVSAVQFENPGGLVGGTANFFLQNVTAGTLAYTGPSVASGSVSNTGSLPPSTIPLSPGVKYAWYVTGSGTMGQTVSMQICQ